MSGFWVPPGKQSFYDPATGAPLAGASVYHYVPGTSTPKDTFQDQGETVLNQNPVILDANGEATIWGEGLYRQVVITAQGVTLWDQVTGFLISAGTVTFASPAEVLAGIRNDVVISPYALAQSGVLTPPIASPAQVAAGTLNTVFMTPYSLAQSGVILPVASAAEVAALTTNVKVITPKGLGDSGVLGGSGSAFPSLTSFGFVGDGTTDNQSLLASVLASSSSLIYVPDGTFYIGGDGPTQRAKLQRRFWGPGKFLFADGYCTPGRYSYISTAPTLWPNQGVTGWFRDDTTSVESEWHTIGVGTRKSLTARYFESAFLPHNLWFDVFSGASGLLTMANAALAIGATSATLFSADGLTVGGVYGMTPYGQDGTITDTITVDTIVGSTITFHPALTTAYPNVAPFGTTPGLATFLDGHRTWAGLQYMKVGNGADGGGDVYGAIARLTQNYVAKAGQRHVFNTSTIGAFGGEMTFATTASGTYGTGWENQANDNGSDVAYAAFVDSFTRNNDTGARGAFWVGHLFQGGPFPVDVMNLFSGHLRFGMDLTKATLEDSSLCTAPVTAGSHTVTLASAAGLVAGDLIGPTNSANISVDVQTVQSVVGNVVTIVGAWVGSYSTGQRFFKGNGGAAVNLALGQTAIIFNSTVGATGRGADPGGLYPTIYGNQTGDMMLYSGNDGTPTSSDFLWFGFNRPSPNNTRIRVRPTVVQINTLLQVGGNIEAAAQLVCGGATPQVVLGAGLGAWIERDAASGRIRATSNNGASYSFLT